MAPRKTKPNVGRRRFIRRTDVFQPIVSAIKAAGSKPIGLILTFLAVILSINYYQDKNNNWLITVITKLVSNTTWKWLGTWLNGKRIQTIHSLWLIATCFLATKTDQAVVVAAISTVITLACNATDNTDAILQCVSLYFIFAFRKPVYRLGAICTTALLVVYGQVYKQFSLD